MDILSILPGRIQYHQIPVSRKVCLWEGVYSFVIAFILTLKEEVLSWCE